MPGRWRALRDTGYQAREGAHHRRSTPLSTLAVAAPAAPLPAPRAGQVTIAQFNVENLFPPGDSSGGADLNPTPEQYAIKLAKLTHAIVDELHAPDILAVEEVGNPQALADLLKGAELVKLGYRSVEMPTNDKRHINVAVLYRGDRVQFDGASQLTPDVPKGMKKPYGQIDGDKLFARPPLVADFTITGAGQAAEGARQIELVVNHLMAKRGGEKGTDPFRNAQADHLAGYVDAQRAAHPERGMIVMGDLNTAYGDDAYKRLEQAKDGANRLFDTPALKLPAADRYTYVYKGEHDMLDHVMVTPDLKSSVSKVEIPHFNTNDPWDAGKHGRAHEDDPSSAAGVSDHDPILTTIDFGAK